MAKTNMQRLDQIEVCSSLVLLPKHRLGQSENQRL